MWNDFANFLKTLTSVPQIWWRDDDATQDSEALQNYLQSLHGMPLLLAVIADSFDESLVRAVQDSPHIRIAQHGFSHTNHASPAMKKNEYPDTRNETQVLAEWQAGKARLTAKFQEQFLPVFVPPWNRMADKFIPLLSQAGFSGVSLFAGESKIQHGLIRRDAHIDMIDWQQDKKFIGTEAVLESLKLSMTKHDIIGIMTHHLVHCDSCNRFLLDMRGFLMDNQALIKVVLPPFEEKI